jgi:hypothetical protein
MTSDHPQPARTTEHRRPRRRPVVLPLCASLATLLLVAAVAAYATPSGTPSATPEEAGRLDSTLAKIAKFADRRVRPAARRLARELPAGAEGLRALREPAGTTQDQAKIALDELRQMSLPATLDPHYAPALVAAGRAFVAATGQDPLTGTTINPEYSGLDSELAASEARLAGSASEAAKLSARVGQLRQALARSKRRAQRLTRRLRHGGARRGR